MNIYEDENDIGICSCCGESYDCNSELDSELAAEWWVDNKSVMAHYECGVSNGWDRA